MPEITLEQATCAIYPGGELRWFALSPGFQENWKTLWAPRLLGQRPTTPSVFQGEAIQVCTLAKRLIGIDRLASLDDMGTILGCHLLVLSDEAYRWAAGDPFALADACPTNWHLRGTLPCFAVNVPPPRRTVAQVCEVLKRTDLPLLLGATQALVDGGRVALVRAGPDTALMRALWMLLPASVRCELRPASFALGHFADFHVEIVPEVKKGDFDHRYLSEEQADNYPEGRYEYGVQAAAEAGDQEMLDGLFARRSRGETWRLGLWLAGLMIVLLALSAVFKGCGGN
jgi:hypothetical protein